MINKVLLKNMDKDALKFFHNYIRTSIEIGGINLPRAISTKSGIKLGKLYKERGLTDGLEKSLTQIYTVLGAKPTIYKIDDDTLEIEVKHSRKLCPIGGAYNPSNAEIFQQNICLPYTIGFLSEITDNNFKFNIDIEQCILTSNKKTCKYCLKKKAKNV